MAQKELKNTPMVSSPSMPDLSSSTLSDFKTPQPPKRRFARFRKLRRSKKETIDPSSDKAETMSLCSISSISSVKSESKRRFKFKNPIHKMTSLASMAFNSPPVRALKRTVSFLDGEAVTPSSKRSNVKIYRSPEVKYRPRQKKSWLETVENSENFDRKEIKRQEAIYELQTTEEALRDDLKIVLDCMYHPLEKILLTREEHETLFSNVATLLPIHDDLISKLELLRNNDGTVDNPGEVVLEWSPQLRALIRYCSNLAKAKELYDNKKQGDPGFSDFLNRCRLSSFSHRLEMWDFLDAPRSILMKYPLLLTQIKDLTSKEHPDMYYLETSLICINEIIRDIDKETGEARCANIKERLYYCYDDETKDCPAVRESSTILFSGILKNMKNRKFEVYLFDKAFVISRPATRSEALRLQVSKEPIPVDKMFVEDLEDGEIRLGGSLRNTLTRESAKFVFRVLHRKRDCLDSFSFQARDEHDKKAWLSALRSAIPSSSKDMPESLV
ncbi:rho guanine nucleotide exchange factor 3-like [Oscarella lobularis]|uniref:rho guanine nucleotide exchange factor 3-like n=1 Tax=Oscarella lobularis TaxID=121494 RepID=UPI0033142B49